MVGIVGHALPVPDVEEGDLFKRERPRIVPAARFEEVLDVVLLVPLIEVIFSASSASSASVPSLFTLPFSLSLSPLLSL
jgi:hypothetical protein